jgi:hypothetical protein
MASGDFVDRAGNQEAFSEQLIKGVWKVATPATYAAGVAATAPTAAFDAVSCAMNQVCVAAGWFTDSRGNVQAMSERWAPTQEFHAVPAKFATGVQNASPSAAFTSISCATATACTAVGFFTDANDNVQALHEAIGTGVSVSASAPAVFGTSVQSTSPNARFVGVSCVNATTCTAAGSFTDANGNVQAVTQSERAGVWSAAVPLVAGSGVQSATPNAEFSSVSCAQAGSCAAVGRMLTSSGATVAVQELDIAGVWQAAVPVVYASGVGNVNPYDGALSVSCSGVANCSIAGYFATAAGSNEAMTASIQDPLTIGHSLRAGAKGHAYIAMLAASGGSTYHFTMVSGTLPPGLHLNSTTVVVSGIPTVAGVYAFSLFVNAGTASGNQSVQISVAR